MTHAVDMLHGKLFASKSHSQRHNEEVMPLTLHKFYFDAIMRAKQNGERYGQAMFNHLSAVRPELAEQVRGTSRDPFHVSSLSDPRWDKFVEHIESRWYLVTRATNLEIRTPSVAVPVMPKSERCTEAPFSATQATESQE